jgi:hypothetical protein
MDRWRQQWQNNAVIRRIPERALLWTICLCTSISTVNGSTQTNDTKHEVWWSLKRVVRPTLPEGPESNPIDRFLNAELRNRGIQAVGAADNSSLLRRVYLDLIGIPPSPSGQEAFLADQSADAYEKVVDQLLANEQHAVRYARHWLDVLRYADTDERMTAEPGIHLWRDWVINALHDDVPYDQVVQIQLTGRRANERSGFAPGQISRPGDSNSAIFWGTELTVGPTRIRRRRLTKHRHVTRCRSPLLQMFFHHLEPNPHVIIRDVALALEPDAQVRKLHVLIRRD